MSLPEYKKDFLKAAVAGGALRFGSFELKSKRTSPYFFNAGDFYTGELHEPFMDAYAQTIASSELAGGFDVLFGPAYKGIPLAATVFYALVKMDRARYAKAAYSFDRKEAKDHGEGGSIVGSPLKGKRVLIIDDVVSAGTAKRQAIDMIRASGGTVVGIVVALDRQETLPDGDGKTSAIGQLRKEYQIPIISIVKLEDIIDGMKGLISDSDIKSIEDYRTKFGASD
ncbi:orotate phosphoribosyltransferase [Hypoxylon rubiginosum]|uniref:Orotate phosphoribosyltransferase n=1 Tax=Hypoxylon rubiginosum TaxID=110542 RepID=A0ACC0D652_9PEZI|nr:orotate phosphoribosyltransferase [Hypoxylon rubiginosum]